jgi:hypothetical protein
VTLSFTLCSIEQKWHLLGEESMTVEEIFAEHGDTCKHNLEKIGGDHGKRKFPARKCRAQNKTGEIQ